MTTKLNLPLLLLAIAGLAACSSDEPQDDGQIDIDDSPIIEEEVPTETVADDATDDDETTPQAVEESVGDTGEDDDQEKPLILAQSDAPDTTKVWKYKEGENYFRMVPTQPTFGGAGKIEVAEFFWYGCGHCYEFEPYINEWAKDIPADVRLVRIPAMWNPLVRLHAQLYYVEEVLGKNGQITNAEEFRQMVFNEYHRRGNRMTSVAQIRDIFTRAGVSAEDFDATWSSFEVAQKMKRADDLARRYGVTGVPTMAVNGKYRTGGAEAGGSYPVLMEIIDELIERESAR